MNNVPTKKTLPLGRIMRLLLGMFFIYEVHDVYLGADFNGVLVRLSWAIALALFYLVMHVIIRSNPQKINPVIGSILAFGPLLAVFFIGYGGPAATGALTYLAVALLIAAIRADPGCEVMSLPALFTKKHTHLVCLLFSPLDWIEKKVTAR